MSTSALETLWQQQFGRSRPEKIVCVGLNYRDHAEEQGVDLPDVPLFFLKPPSSLVGSGDAVVIPPESDHVDAEAELAIVIGEAARRVAESDALEVIAGYTCANDVSARDIQFSENQWFRSKGFDTFCPLLPKIVSTENLGNAGDLRIVQRLNGEPLQDSRTSSLIFAVETIVARISDVVSLLPGDVILTGTPAGVGIFREPLVPLRDGDVVEVEIEGIGTLSNPVVVERR